MVGNAGTQTSVTESIAYTDARSGHYTRVVIPDGKWEAGGGGDGRAPCECVVSEGGIFRTMGEDDFTKDH